MKKITYAILAVAAAFATVSCNKEIDPYEPAPVPDNDQVYFSKDLTTSYNLDEYKSDSVYISVNRVKTDSDLPVQLKVSFSVAEQKSFFKVPSTVSFKAGEDETKILISYNREEYGRGNSMDITFKIADESLTTPYGKDSVVVTIAYPKKEDWILFDKGVMVEAGWNETEKGMTMYYKPWSADGKIVLCKVAGCWGHDTKEQGEPYEVQDYMWYWNRETNACYVIPQYMGYKPQSSEGYCYCADAAGFYILYQGWATSAGLEFMSEKYLNWAPGWLAKNGFSVPYYDGNGCFYLGDWLFYATGGDITQRVEDLPAASYPVATGYGIQFGGDQDTFTGGSFIRTTDYNKDLKYTKILLGTDSSMVWNNQVFDISLSTAVDPDNNPAAPSEILYIPDYFTTGSGLAFKLALSDTTAGKGQYVIQDGVNVQHTGYYMFGKEVGANIVARKSSVSGHYADGLPVKIELCINIDLYSVTYSEDGKPTYTKETSMGEFMDYINITKTSWYSADQLYGLKKGYYSGNFNLFAKDIFASSADQEDVYWPVSMEDAGTIEGSSYVKINKFIPINEKYVPDRSWLVEWYNGYLYGVATKKDTAFVLDGQKSDIYIYPMNSETYYYYPDAYILGGYYYNDTYECIAFTNYPYNDDAVDGLYICDSNNQLGIAYKELCFEWTEEASSASKYPSAIPAKWEIRRYSQIKNALASSKAIHKGDCYATLDCTMPCNGLHKTMLPEVKISHNGTINTDRMQVVRKRDFNVRFDGKKLVF